ncbi:MAG: hypothetical protein LUG89_04795 [Methanosphaera sp.]|nr:hypothetical protein [Methanosphaera sp.]
METRNYVILSVVGIIVGLIINPYLGLLLLIPGVYQLYKYHKVNNLDETISEKETNLETLNNEIDVTLTLQEKQNLIKILIVHIKS